MADFIATSTTTRDRPSSEADVVRRLQARIEAQSAVIASQAASSARERATFERAFAAARTGVWECDLGDESLRWTDSVYDMFDVPRGAALERRRTLDLYPPASLAALERIRSQAIAERRGFELDAEIVTSKGRRRWIRITATLDCDGGRPSRIFGMKQDVTEEKEAADRIRRLAERDAMTGLANRSLFDARFSTFCRVGADPRPRALLIVDLDGFKQVNDTYGHTLGDACLTTAAARIRSVCGETEFVARIGGDEFAVLTETKAPVSLARRIVETLRRPIDVDGRSLKLGASVGVAHAETCAPEDLFARADAALYAAKAAGRNTFRLYGPMTARHGRMRAA